MSIIFWIQAGKAINFSYKYILAVLFIALSIIGYSGTGIIIIPVIFIYILLNSIQSPVKLTKKVIIPVIALVLVLVASKIYAGAGLADRSINLSDHVLFVLQHPFSTTTNFLTSIGNLMLGWFIPFNESYISLTSANFWTQIAGYILVF